jgi:hypothetical protein
MVPVSGYARSFRTWVSMRHDTSKANPRSVNDARLRVLLPSVLLVSMAWLVYRPDRVRPFHVVDFTEFLPRLLAGTDFFDRIGALVKYYVSQGRFNVIPYTVIAAKWEMFKWWSPGWQITRALLMLFLCALTFRFLRRLRATHFGAFVGASVFLWAPAASDGWVHLTMGEPLGAAIALVLSLRALRYQSAAHWNREVAVLAVGSVALIWTKELLFPLLLLPITLALTFNENEQFERPRLSKRNLALAAGVGSAIVFAIVPVATVYLSATEAAYSAMYGTGSQSLAFIAAVWVSSLVPFELFATRPSFVWLGAVIGYVVLVGLGWRQFLRREQGQEYARFLLGLALTIPLIGLLVYQPNPWIARFYSLPYLIGTAMLIGFAASNLSFDSGARRVRLFCTMLILLFAVSSASEVAVRREAIQRRDHAVISFVSDSAAVDSVIFATNRPPPAEWLTFADSGSAPRGLGATLNRFARASSRPWPPTRDLGCDRAQNYLRPQPNRFVVVNLEETCDFDALPTRYISIPFRWVDWTRLKIVGDSTQARIFVVAETPR